MSINTLSCEDGNTRFSLSCTWFYGTAQ